MDRLEPSVADDEHERAIQSLFHDLEGSGALPAQVPAYQATYTVLCALEMRLPRRQAEKVARDVPPTLRTLISRCTTHRTHRPEISFDESAFLRLVASTLQISAGEAERLTRAVFAAVQKLMPQDEILDVRHKLPLELDALWYPEPFEPAPESATAPVGGRPVEEPTESFLREIEQSGVLPEEMRPIEALQAVLCSLSQELTGHEAQELADTSRTLHRLLGPCVEHRGERPHVMQRPTFVHQLAEHLGVDEPQAERIARTVFATVRGRLPADEVRAIDGRIPRSVRELWTLR